MHQSERVNIYALYELLYEEIISPSNVWKYPEKSSTHSSAKGNNWPCLLQYVNEEKN
jgi:hypothetical protein